MYPQNEGPRAAQQENKGGANEAFNTENAFHAGRTEQALTEAKAGQNEAAATRTAERWWLRKRLSQQ